MLLTISVNAAVFRIVEILLNYVCTYNTHAMLTRTLKNTFKEEKFISLSYFTKVLQILACTIK